jgi:hypothetical protein
MCLFFGFVVKKVTTTMSSPFSMVVVWWRRQWLKGVFFPLFTYKKICVVLLV